jgi:hypothetical protein
MWQKDWVRLTFGRSMKHKNMQKQENLIRNVKTMKVIVLNGK